MKISEIIKVLNKAKKEYGDVSVYVMHAEFGYLIEVQSITKTHPYTAPYNCLNRNEPVNGIVFEDCDRYDTDLKIS